VGTVWEWPLPVPPVPKAIGSIKTRMDVKLTNALLEEWSKIPVNINLKPCEKFSQTI